MVDTNIKLLPIFNKHLAVYCLILLSLCAIVQCYTWCKPNDRLYDEYKLKECSSIEPFLRDGKVNYEYKELSSNNEIAEFTKYDFKTDQCHSYIGEVLSWKKLKIEFKDKWYIYPTTTRQFDNDGYRRSAYYNHDESTYFPSCIKNQYNTKYVGNNLYMSTDYVRNYYDNNKNKLDIELLNKTIAELCPNVIENVFKVKSLGSFNVTEINIFLKERLGEENIQAENHNNTLKFRDCSKPRINSVFRDKEVENTCYHDFPILISSPNELSSRILFTEDGVNLKDSSCKAVCPCIMPGFYNIYFQASLLVNIVLACCVVVLTGVFVSVKWCSRERTVKSKVKRNTFCGINIGTNLIIRNICNIFGAIQNIITIKNIKSIFNGVLIQHIVMGISQMFYQFLTNYYLF